MVLNLHRLEIRQPAGSSGIMRSISGPISRMWCQFYADNERWNSRTSRTQVISYVDVLGFSQQSVERRQMQFSTNSGGSRPDPESVNTIGCGCKTSDLNSADSRVLGQNPTAAPTTQRINDRMKNFNESGTVHSRCGKRISDTPRMRLSFEHRGHKRVFKIAIPAKDTTINKE